jgi:AcrR family transcriptional regulator
MAGRPRTISDDEILAAAGRAIGRLGPTRLTLAHVAREVGLTPATLIQRFGSKRGLLLAFSARGVDAVGDVFARARAAHADPLAALSAAIAALVVGIDSPATLANHIAFLHVDLTDPDLHRQAAHHSRQVRAQMRILLAAAIDAGQLIRTDCDRLSEAIYTTYNGALLTWAMDGTGDLESWLQARVDFILAPYRPPAPPADSSVTLSSLGVQQG